VEVQEKVVISEWASTGTYWFRSVRDFERVASDDLQDHDMANKELYVAPLYNRLIEAGAHVRHYAVDRFLCFGTPHDLESALRELQDH
jgi:NDP-sugar pyrophosphorylase family protein